jgi:hypothetical protein
LGAYEKLIAQILSGKQDSSLRFAEIINLQPLKSKAKAYQVKQVRDLIVKYRLEVKVK